MFLDHSTFAFPAFLRDAEPDPEAQTQTPSDWLVVTPRGLGLGEDMIIGGSNGRRYRVIDLSRLNNPVEIHWSGEGAGYICDGADSLVFQGVERIVLPLCMIQTHGAA